MSLVSEAMPVRDPIVIPYLTLRHLDECVRVDQGNAYRANLKRVLPHIADIYRSDEDEFRSHMGASVLGKECQRAIWLDFRWAMPKSFEGRMLRLFNRGHIEEGRVIALLLTCGFQYYQQDEDGNQFRISAAGGHIGGSGDGVVLGVLDLPSGTPLLAEIKTHSDKYFQELAGKNSTWRAHVEDPAKNAFLGKGVEQAKPEHYIQMQIYLRRMNLPAALYVAVNKDTDDIYMELVKLKPEVDERAIELGTKLVYQKFPPPKINNSPGYWKCRFCDARPVCQMGEPLAVNCRTCVHSLTLEDGTWNCTLRSLILNKEAQLKGCELHRPIDQ